MPCRVFVLALFASSLAATAGCSDGSTASTAPPPNEKQIQKEGKRPQGGPAGPKSK